MPYGYHGRILHVDLTHGRLEDERPPESFYRKFMGGSALGMHYVLAHTPPRADPLGPDNTLVLALSVVTGAGIAGLSRMTAVARSPLSGAIGDSQSGGFWPAELKFAGFDAIVIRGQSATPVYLYLNDGVAELRDASHLWGRLTGEVDALLKAELDDRRIEILQCGIAGERGVRFAALMSMSNRAAGRTGMGAVMGSKRLKAVVVRGTQRPLVADPDALKALARWGAAHRDFADDFGKYGTAGATMSMNLSGGLPTHNFDSGFFEGANNLDGGLLYDAMLRGAAEGKQDRLGRDTCYACTVRCKRVVAAENAEYRIDPLYGGPEYETIAAFGSYCGIDDLYAVSAAGQLCNMYGMDTISCGATIAWAMDCFEAGILTTADTGGLDLSYGNASSMVALTEMIGRREGIGDLLANGAAHAADQLGRGSAARVVAAKKVDLPAHMPRVKRGLGLIYAVNPFGADHQSSEHDPMIEGDGFDYYRARLAEIGFTAAQARDSIDTEKVRFMLVTQHLYGALDSLNICQFVFGPSWQLFSTSQLVEAVNAITGWALTIEDLLRLGERRVNMQRLFNAREGFGRADDTLPPKLAKALAGGPSDGRTFAMDDLERMKDAYYRLSGWDLATGMPAPDKLAELGLDGYPRD